MANLHLSHAELAYLVAVVIALTIALCRRRRLANLAKVAAALAVAAAAMAAVSWGLVQARYGRGARLGLVSWPSLLAQALLLAGLLLVFAGLDRLAGLGTSRLVGVRPAQPAAPLSPRRLSVLAARLLVFWMIGIPWLLAFLQTHRPKLDYPERPAAEYRELPANADLPHGWVIPAERPSDTTVLLCHGIGADQGDMIPFSQMFHRLGCNVVTFDMPGHGRSPGLRTTFGLVEAQTVGRLARWLRANPPPNTPPGRCRLVGFGVSMGGTALLLAAGEDPGLFDALVIDSAYARLDAMAEHQLDMLPGLMAWPARLTGRLFVACEIGRPIGRVDATTRIRRLDHVPKLLFHCRDDPVVPFEQGRILFDSAGGLKRFVDVEAGGHIGGFSADHSCYVEAIRQVLQPARRTSQPAADSPTPPSGETYPGKR